MGGGADVIGLRIARTAKTPNGVEEVERPADKQRNHQQMDVKGQIVHFLAMLRSQRRQEIGMEARFRLVQNEQARWPRRKERGDP